MSKAGDTLILCCRSLSNFPSLVLCFFLIIIQAATIDYYLIHYLALGHLFWTIGDLIVLIFVIICFRFTQTVHFDGVGASIMYSFIWVTWLVMQTCLAVKVIVICSTFSTELDEEKSFFGPNTLKTAIALGSCIFVLLLSSQHDTSPGSERRRYIEELTGTVVFDILDTADILDVLFDEEIRKDLYSGIPETIMTVATLNLLIPTVPLITLSKTKFGLSKLRKRMVYIHRLLLVLIINVPNLIVRMLLWHGFSAGISPFTLKNIILICMTAYEFYEHKKEKFEEHENEQREMVEMEKQNGGVDGHSHNGQSTVVEDIKIRQKDKKDGQNIPDRRSQSSSKNEEIHFDIESRMVTSM